MFTNFKVIFTKTLEWGLILQLGTIQKQKCRYSVKSYCKIGHLKATNNFMGCMERQFENMFKFYQLLDLFDNRASFCLLNIL
jgi:hypothetical protein